MSHYLPALEAAIMARLLADTGVGGLFDPEALLLAVHPKGAAVGKGIYNGDVEAAAEGSVFPAILFAIEQGENNDTFRTRSREVTLTLSIFLDRKPATYNPLHRGAAILERVEGDWTEQAAGTAPTYGLDRWQPTLAGTEWTADIFDLGTVATAHDDEVYHWTMRFTIHVSRTGV